MTRALLIACLAAGGVEAEAGFPASDEALTYTINWPSGLSLGEGNLRARRTAGRWEFEFTFEAAVPGFAVADRFRSLAGPDLCSLEFERDLAHGNRKSREKTAFDLQKLAARRATHNGGKSEFPIPACPRDALSFIFHLRQELARGRVPPPQQVYYGGAYSLRLEFTGPQVVSVNDRKVVADRVAASLKGAAADAQFEMFFGRDAARTPVLVRIPLPLASFTMELVR